MALQKTLESIKYIFLLRGFAQNVPTAPQQGATYHKKPFCA
jgi:hypothetical protein